MERNRDLYLVAILVLIAFFGGIQVSSLDRVNTDTGQDIISVYTEIDVECNDGRTFNLSTNAPGGNCVVEVVGNEVISGKCEDKSGNSASVTCGINDGKGACTSTEGEGTCTPKGE